MKYWQLNLRWAPCNTNLINNNNDHSILHSKHKYPTILIYNTGVVTEEEVVDNRVAIVDEAVADKEVEDKVSNSNEYSEQILSNTISPTVLAVIPVGSAKAQKKDIIIAPLSTWNWMVSTTIVQNDSTGIGNVTLII